MKNLTLFFLAFLAFACTDESTDQIRDEKINQQIVGSWLYVERGYSPGAGYIVEQVPDHPRQTITFEDDFTMSSTNMGLDEFKYYRILEDTVTDSEVIVFLEEDPGTKQLDLAELNPTFSIYWEENDLYLYYRWCFEGCHMKFESVTSSKPPLNFDN